VPPKPTVFDPVLGPLTDDRLTRDFRLYQRSKGHRFSTDDVTTAFVAWQAAPRATRVLDLGCGIGSVLLHLAWKMPSATFVGIEAQAMSYELLVRNVARNGCGERVAVRCGDLRTEVARSGLGPEFDLVTGTPPYFPPGAALDAEDEQRAFARIEYRGGVEDYVEAGAALLARNGAMVLCADARAPARVDAAAAKAGLAIHAQLDLVVREGRPPLFAVWTLRRDPRERERTALVLTDAAGHDTDARRALRAFSGFEPTV
jgi:tRNA1Val (adenine37-N6)-methyltransferase